MFSLVTEEMIMNLDSNNRRKLDFIMTQVENDGPTSPLVLYCFSGIAFSLAKDSIKTNTVKPITAPLLDVFTKFVNSDQISPEEKKKMKLLIGETELDFSFASGNRKISSLRLAPYLMA